MSNYRICNRCVMDTTAIDIKFDEMGNCNYCNDFISKLLENEVDDVRKQNQRESLITQIKKDGQGKEYDCIFGVSGGIDSSYGLYLAVKLGLRPLAVHLDNGWNSELSSHNISNLVNCLGVDLYTHVIDWEENKDLQLSFFKANVVDIEMLMDNAMWAINYQQAIKYKTKYILSGCNLATEGMPIPERWKHYKYDARNIKKIHKKYGSIPIKTHPIISSLGYIWLRYIRQIKFIPFLDYFNYNKSEAIEILKRDVNYKPYPYKHYESVFTRFYQAYILPQKFGYDKRRVHLSTLIISKQMSREEALEVLKRSPYEDKQLERQDKIFVMKKLGFTEQTFNDYLNSKEVRHEFYGSEIYVYSFFKGVRNYVNDLKNFLGFKYLGR